jgi:outer membrane protein assembly factor BamA
MASISSTVNPFAAAGCQVAAVVARVNINAARIVFVTDMAGYYHDRVPSGRVMLRVAAALVIVAAACSSAPTRVRKPGEEYLAKIAIEGNSALSDATLLRGLSLYRAQQAGRGLDEYQLSLDISRIQGAYQQRGYLAVVVEPRITLNGDAATLTFKITEGVQAKSTVEITGLPPEVAAAEARELVKLAAGAPFDYIIYDEAKLPLIALVENVGYAHAELDATVLADRVKHRAILRYSIDPGPRVQFGDVEVIGATGELADAVRRRAKIRHGEVYSTKAVAETQQAIYGIGRFSRTRSPPIAPT